MQEDISIYLSSVLSNLGMGVLVCDLTWDKKIISCTKRPKEAIDVVSYRGVDFSESFKSEYMDDVNHSIVILVMDVYTDISFLNICDDIYFVTGCERMFLETAKNYMREHKVPMNLVLKDVSPPEMRKKYLERISDENAFILDKYFLPTDVIDEGYRIAMQYDSFGSFSELSPEYGKLITAICKKISGAQKTDVKRAYALAKKGVSICA